MLNYPLLFHLHTINLKTLLAALIIYLAVLLPLSAQQTTRNVRFRSIGKDSINLHFDPDYFLIEDTCSSIVRYGHFNFKERYFFGNFRDLNKLDPQIILAEGKYTSNGNLDGAFAMRYLNGSPRAEGAFEDGVLRGQWKFFYDDGSPKLDLSADGGIIKILNARDDQGKATVTDGNGVFRVALDEVFWEGKLLNGLPDGTWKSRKVNDRSGTILSSEIFKNNKFIRGSGPVGVYTDNSRLSLLSSDLFPIQNAAGMLISPTACDPALSRHKVVYAVYRDGWYSLNEDLSSAVRSFFQKIDLKIYEKTFMEINAEISDRGLLTNIKASNMFDEKISSALIKGLMQLPSFEPALIDGKPIKSNIRFTFKFENGLYSFQYRLLPIKAS